MPGRVATMPAASTSTTATGAATKTVAKTRNAALRGPSTRATAAAPTATTSTSRSAADRPTARPAATSSSSTSSRSTSATVASSSTRSTSASTSTATTRASAVSSRAASTSKSASTSAKPTSSAAVPATSATRTTRARTALAPSTAKPASASKRSVRTVDQTWTEAEVLTRLATPKAFPEPLPYYVLLQLGATAEALHLDAELGIGPIFGTEPAKLTPARCVYFAKQLVNAGLAFLSELTSSGWTASAADPSSEAAHVLAAVNTFRMAARFLLLPRDAGIPKNAGKQKELEVETVILRTCTKLKTIGFAKAAHADCQYLARITIGDDDGVAKTESASTVMLLPPFSPCSEPTIEPTPTRISFLVDLQCSSATHALEAADLASLDTIVADLNHEHGPLAWQLYGRRNGGEVRVLDRTAFATERAISKALQRLEAPNSQEYLPLRTLALQLLVQVSDIDLVAFWERVARAGGAVLKTAQKDGEDVASAYHAVHDTFETVIATAANVAENAEGKSKLQGEGFQRFCEYWLTFARKAGSALGVERATAAMSEAALPAQSGSAESPIVLEEADSISSASSRSNTPASPASLSEKDVARICAILTGSVLALDKILAGSSEPDTQAKLDDAARILQHQVATWPATAPMSSQLKLYRVLDQLHRRACSKLSNQGCDSKGQPKADPTGSANVDKLSRACLQLLHSLLDHSEAPVSASSTSSDVASKSTPSRTASLPNREACLTDIVYGYRVLANRLFSASSRSARDEALIEMKKCHALLKRDVVQSLSNKVVSEQLRLLSTSFYNPAGILYNATNYVEAAEFLQLAVDCDHESMQLLRAGSDLMDAVEQQELEGTLTKRQEALNKKIEYTAVAYRFSGNKVEALQTYRQLLFAIASTTGEQLGRLANSSSIEESFRTSEAKAFVNPLKAIVDLSVHELMFEMDLDDEEHSLANWLISSSQLEPSVKGAILEQAAHLLEARSHLASSVRAIDNLHQALLQIYDAAAFPLRRARTLARKLQMDVLSHALVLSEDDVVQMEADAMACLNREEFGQDQGLARFQSQYRCSVLLSAALHARLRRPFDGPQDLADKVELGCKGLASALAASSKTTQPSTPQASRSSPKANAVTPTFTPVARGAPRRATAAPARTATVRKALAQRSAPPQATATPAADPITPPAKTGKPAFEAAASSLTRRSPSTSASAGAARNLDRPESFCQSLLAFHEAFSALALTRCSVQILKAVRQATRHGTEVLPGMEDLFCRASADLAEVYMALGKIHRAESVLRSSTGVLSKHASPASPTSKLVLVSQDVRFRCLMAQAALLSQERDLSGAQARFADGLKLAQTPSKGDKPSTSSMERLRQRERQAMAFSVCAHLQMARGDLACSIESTTLALRQLIRLSSNLSHIAAKTQTSEPGPAPSVQSDGMAPSSDVVMDSEEPKQQYKEEQQQLPKFSGATFSSLFWRSCGLLLTNYMRLSRLHSVRGSAVDAEAMAGEGIDFATSLQFALPLARALIQRGELRLQLNRPEQGQEDLSRCLEVLQNTWIPEVVSLSYVQGDCLMRIEQLGEALRSYTAGEATLRSLSTAFSDAEHAMPSPRAMTHHRRKSSSSSPAAQTRGRHSNGVSTDMVLPELQSRLLQRQAWILHLMGEAERSEEAVEKAASIRDGLATVDARVDQFVLEGRIALRRAMEHLKGDHFFSMLPEATISIPMVPSVSVRTLVAAAGSHQTISEETVRTALGMLTPADSAFREALSLGLHSSHSLVLREAFASLAQVYTTQAALGKNVKMAANAAAALLDWASSVGVRRSLLVSIASKLRGPSAALEDQEWPSIANDEQPGLLGTRLSHRHSAETDESDEEEALPSRLAKLSLKQPAAAQTSRVRGAPSASPLSAFWQSVRLRHQQAQHEPGSDKHLLPRNWTVISISVRGTDVENLVLTRQEGGGGADGCTAKEAVLYSLPMNRRSQREGTEEDEEQLTLRVAQDKLEEIVRLSNDGIHGVKDVQSMDARRQWWTERHRLDDELRDLLQSIQDTWLGGFKGVFSEPTSDARAITALRARFEKIIRRACFPTANKRPSKLKLDDAVFECFAGLPADCTDEDLEDLVHYVMDALQFSGFQVAVDEIDLDETAMDLRGALEEFHGKKAQTSPNKTNMAYVAVDEEEEAQDHHMFLVLDKDTSVFPWESMPILRGRAVSRIPSMAFLQDRIELAKVFRRKPDVEEEDDVDMDEELEHSPLQKGKQAARSRSRSPSKPCRSLKSTTLGGSKNSAPGDVRESETSHSAWQVALRNGKLFSLSKRKTFYLLNPGGDLVQSQDRFEGWLKGRGATHGWKGIVGRQPIVDELPDALSSSDVLLYFGHGGAEQFIRQSKVRELQRCAVALLWGCSSAMLHDNGEFDRTGTPLNYMCGGAPAMVGNLWDMTDRELDSVCEGVFGRIGLMEAGERAEVKPAARNIKLDRRGNLEASRAPTEMSLARAVAESRNDCRLPYLTGAATVVYGVPVYWNDGEA